MNNRRHAIIILSIIMLVVFCFFSCGFSLENNVAKLIIDTPLYANCNLDSEFVLEKICANEAIELSGDEFDAEDGLVWQKVIYNKNFTGYILSSYIYYTTDTSTSEIIIKKAYSRKMGEKITVYASHDENSEIIGSYEDGESVNTLIEQSVDYGEFTKILYNDEYAFVKTDNLTKGLSYNQKLAVIIASGVVGALIVIGIFSFLIYKKKRNS